MTMPAPTEPPRHLHALEAPPPDDDYDDQVPEDRAAEQAVLGAMLHTARARDTALDILTGTDFRLPAHEAIWDAITYLHFNGDPVDTLTVADHLDPKTLRRIGGAAYLGDLYGGVVTAENVDHHAHIVAKAATRRRLDAAGTAIRQLATTPGDLDQILDRAGTELAKATSSRPATTGPHPWAPVDLAAVWDNDEDLEQPTVLTRRDGLHLLYPGAVHSISGEPESGKTWVALIATTQELAAGNHVTYVDFEDRAGRVIARLRDLGATRAQVVTGLHYIRPHTALDPTGRTHLDKAATTSTLAVIDGVTEAMTMHGLSLLDNEDAARYLDLLPRHLADLGPAVLQVDHVVKDSERQGRWAIGAGHKLAGLDGAAYGVKVLEPFGRGKRGRALLTVHKDRPGSVREHTVGNAIAELVIDSTADQLFAWLDRPTESEDAAGNFRPTVLMERVSRFVEAHPGIAKGEVEKQVRGKGTVVRQALQILVDEGWITEERGQGRTLYLREATPFRTSDEPVGGDEA